MLRLQRRRISRGTWVFLTLLYEIASKSSLIWAGFWMSSALEDSGCEVVRASMANTRWTSFRTIRSFCWRTNVMLTAPFLRPFIGRREGGEGSHHVPLGLSLIRPQVLHVGGKTLVQPQVIPPVQGDQITEPLQGRMRRRRMAVREGQEGCFQTGQMFLSSVSWELL